MGSVLAGSIHEGASLADFPGKVTATIDTLWRNAETAREATCRSEISFTVREDRDIERGKSWLMTPKFHCHIHGIRPLPGFPMTQGRKGAPILPESDTKAIA